MPPMKDSKRGQGLFLACGRSQGTGHNHRGGVLTPVHRAYGEVVRGPRSGGEAGGTNRYRTGGIHKKSIA